jgi:hypothetical protein
MVKVKRGLQLCRLERVVLWKFKNELDEIAFERSAFLDFSVEMNAHGQCDALALETERSVRSFAGE